MFWIKQRVEALEQAINEMQCDHSNVLYGFRVSKGITIVASKKCTMCGKILESDPLKMFEIAKEVYKAASPSAEKKCQLDIE